MGEEVDSESFDLEEDDEINFRNKKYKNPKPAKPVEQKKVEGKFNARRNNKIDADSEEEKEKPKAKKSKITNEILNELNEDAEEALKNKNKDNFTPEEIKKIVEIEEIQKD